MGAPRVATGLKGGYERPAITLLGVAAATGSADLGLHRREFLAQVGRRLTSLLDVHDACVIDSGNPAASDAPATALLGLGAEALVLIALGELDPADALPPVLLEVLTQRQRPLLLANIQPERTVGSDWTDYDFSFNSGVLGAQALAQTLRASGLRFAALTGDWMSAGFAHGVADWAESPGPTDPGATPLRAVPDEPAAHLNADLVHTLVTHARALIAQPGVCEIQAMDWNLDSVVCGPISEPADAADEDTVRSTTWHAQPGPATAALLTEIGWGELLLVVASCELLDVVSAHGRGRFHLRPAIGLDPLLDAWLRRGLPRRFVLTAGDHRNRWREHASACGIESEELR